MPTRRVLLYGLTFGLALAFGSLATAQVTDPLPSWKEAKAMQSIVDFVARTTTSGGTDFVPEPERIATFDNDGTLWAEQPMYCQFAFALERVKALAPHHPEWKEKEPTSASEAGGPSAGARAVDYRGRTQRKPRWLAPDVTSPFPRVPIM